jgi:hypothetical protein
MNNINTDYHVCAELTHEYHSNEDIVFDFLRKRLHLPLTSNRFDIDKSLTQLQLDQIIISHNNLVMIRNTLREAHNARRSVSYEYGSRDRGHMRASGTDGAILFQIKRLLRE